MRDPATRRPVIQAQRLMYLGEIDQAITLLMQALNRTKEHDMAGPGAWYIPRIQHRLAQCYIEKGSLEDGFRRFEIAESLFERRNYIGRAITLRDYGWDLYRNGHPAEGVSKITQALRLLERESSRDERWEIEQAVTAGFLARTCASTNPDEARTTMRATDEIIRGTSKWIYEHGNLVHLVPLLPLHQRAGYQMRANRLYLQMIAADELKVITDDLMHGRLLMAGIGLSKRTVLRTRHARQFLPF